MNEETVSVLVLTARTRACALRLTDLVETMRPLPVEPLPGTPSFLLGMSVIRGAPVPVVDLGELMGATEQTARNRYVTVRTGGRQVALAVDSVVGARQLPAKQLAELPSLVQNARTSAIESLGSLDHQLLTVLSAGKLLSEEVWRQLETDDAPDAESAPAEPAPEAAPAKRGGTRKGGKKGGGKAGA